MARYPGLVQDDNPYASFDDGALAPRASLPWTAEAPIIWPRALSVLLTGWMLFELGLRRLAADPAWSFATPSGRILWLAAAATLVGSLGLWALAWRPTEREPFMARVLPLWLLLFAAVKICACALFAAA